MSKDKSISPIMGMLKPLAKKYITPDNISSIFDSLTEEAELMDGEKAVIILNRGTDGTVMAGLYAVAQSHYIVRRYRTLPVEQLIEQALGA